MRLRVEHFEAEDGTALAKAVEHFLNCRIGHDTKGALCLDRKLVSLSYCEDLGTASALLVYEETSAPSLGNENELGE